MEMNGKTVRFCFVTLAHKEQRDQAKKLMEHYAQFGEATKIVEADFSAKEEHTWRNETLESLQGYDYVFFVDTDEMLLAKDVQVLLNTCFHKPHIRVIMTGILDYVKVGVLGEMRDHEPIVVVNPKTVRFYIHRCAHLDENTIHARTIKVHHLAFLNQQEWKTNLYNIWAKTGDTEATTNKALMDSAGHEVEMPDEMKVFLAKLLPPPKEDGKIITALKPMKELSDVVREIEQGGAMSFGNLSGGPEAPPVFLRDSKETEQKGLKASTPPKKKTKSIFKKLVGG